MAVPRRLPPEFEAVEFRPVHPIEADNKILEWDEREPAWRWLGLLPLLTFISIYFGLIGAL